MMESPDLSLAFYHYLCDVIGSEDTVNMRRHIFTTYENVRSEIDRTLKSSGSKAEGLDLEGSDMDYMHIMNYLPVYENKDVVRHVRQLPETVSFVMDTSDCKIGFTQLKQNDTIYYHPWCEYKADVGFLSSTKFRDSHHFDDTMFTHGPCNTCQLGIIEIDHAFCLRCSTWISQAKPWILRSRQLQASNDVIKAILEFGVLFVPVGCKNSPNIDLEWRISFSYAEKLLIWSFNHVQLLSYALLKILLKDVIKQTTDNLLCSYFLKTVMLWICEETKSSQWETKTMLSCFMSCFNRLRYCVQYKTCAHYFMPENDLFAERFDQQQHSLLLSTLNQLQSFGWTCLLQTQTLRSFINILQPFPSSLTHKVSYHPSLFWLNATYNEYFCEKLNQTLYFCMRAVTKDFYIYMISMLNRDMGGQTLSIVDRRLKGNKQSYNIYRKLLCHLLISLNHDAVSGWLLLASFFYVNKQYQTCLQILSDCLLWCTPEKIYLEINPSKETQTRLIFLQSELGLRPLSTIRKCIIRYVEFSQSSPIFPKEMYVLLNGKEITIPPVVFGICLSFLCFHHLRNDHEKYKSLRALEVSMLDKKFIRYEGDLEKAHMLLSMAYSLMLINT